MLTDINPKLPMRDKAVTRDFYLNKLNFQEFGSGDFDGYLMVQKESIQIHFFEIQRSRSKRKLRTGIYPNRQRRRMVPVGPG